MRIVSVRDVGNRQLCTETHDWNLCISRQDTHHLRQYAGVSGGAGIRISNDRPNGLEELCTVFPEVTRLPRRQDETPNLRSTVSKDDTFFDERGIPALYQRRAKINTTEPSAVII